MQPRERASKSFWGLRVERAFFADQRAKFAWQSALKARAGPTLGRGAKISLTDLTHHQVTKTPQKDRKGVRMRIRKFLLHSFDDFSFLRRGVLVVNHFLNC
jgi:hypothetical protein